MTDLTLSQAQRAFSLCVAKLILWAYENGYEITLGEAHRSTATARVYAEQGRGIPLSLHCERLAVDLNLWKGGEWLQDSEAHEPLGTYWKSLHELARWGGDFRTTPIDGNHYSFQWRGRK